MALGRTLITVTIGGLALVVVLAVAAWIWIDRVATAGIERGGSRALGVPVAVEDVEVGLTDARLRFASLAVDNPEGFGQEHFLTIGSGGIDVAGDTLLADTIHVPELRLTDIALVLARHDGRTNYGILLERIGGGDEQQPQDEQARWRVDRLVLEDVHVDTGLLPIPTPPFTIDRIEATDLSDAMTTAELSGLVVRILLKEAAKEATGIPVDIAGEVDDLIAGGIDVITGGDGQ